MSEISREHKVTYLREQIRLLSAVMTHAMGYGEAEHAAHLVMLQAMLADYETQEQPCLFPAEEDSHG